jgi:hypothetical protein
LHWVIGSFGYLVIDRASVQEPRRLAHGVLIGPEMSDQSEQLKERTLQFAINVCA